MALNPYCQHHERRKDREYREDAERNELELKNQRLAFELLREKMEFFQSLGITEEQLWAILSRHAFDPIAVLDAYQDSHIIEYAELEIITVEAEPVRQVPKRTQPTRKKEAMPKPK